ncbi:16S rRNA (guanine(527)-N(7))-methyltransferase RsmG [Bacillus carboniphilus]|uniref:Ribosomal RNA small subunit methyltransferase G n=1 Tax=Bacillus carboniphilus TaxID=86663 RepID=A0ABY9JUA2_9BACI|nr:16S rRNA (guanine(527)-N(7))-methyltransferase RsmG [Bacillus carboniphilus]WLR41883.1 16S rRNA (guanine(527)-N(7))-methyltransferase RsmG [Bacillus carboniphilus]
MDTNQFQTVLQERGVHLTKHQIEQFERYYTLLIEWNEKINLTSITVKEDVFLKHFYDSVTAAFYVDFSGEKTLCDVGAGAGFPSLPLKICYPELQVTIVDSLNKRITFLQEVVSELQLTDVSLYHDRAETFAKKKEFRENFDLVTARAVARLSVLSELCLPLAKIGGQFIALKAASANEELEQSKKAIHLLGGALGKGHSFILPIEESERNIIQIDKVRSTPKKFPRKPGTPNKNPLGEE